MQSFPCPFCGPRPETEFRHDGEAGKLRPALSCTDTEWSLYLRARTAARGPSREIWTHLPCMETFVMQRDTLSHRVGEVAP